MAPCETARPIIVSDQVSSDLVPEELGELLPACRAARAAAKLSPS